MTCVIKRIIQFKEAMNWSLVRIYSSQGEITQSSKYSWSVDKCCWTPWSDYKTYLNIKDKIDGDFYLRILIYTDLTRVLVNGVQCENYTISLNNDNIFLQNFCDTPQLFDPYANMDCALQLQQQLADSIICMFGIPIYYIRTEPDKNTADYTFKEYVLHNVTSIKKLKLMLQDGSLPSSSPKLTTLDFDWQTDWEVELSKTQFARAFGDTAFPKARDFVYVPMMKRLWEINSAYDEKSEGLMWRSTTWKLSMIKYEDSTNVNANEYEDIIDSWTKNTYDNVFGIVEANEQARLTGADPLEAPQIASTNVYDMFMEDAVRSQLTKDDITIVAKQYNHGAQIVARNLYKFKNENGFVAYQKQVCGGDGYIAFIIETPGAMQADLEKKPIVSFGYSQVDVSYSARSNKYTISWESMSYELAPFQTYLVTIGWSKSNFILSMEIYKYAYPTDRPVYSLTPQSYSFDFENPEYEQTAPYNNDLNMKTGYPIKLTGYPVYLTNIKYFNTYLSQQDLIKECIKYTTTNPYCVINDLARPIDDGHGYMVK